MRFAVKFLWVCTVSLVWAMCIALPLPDNESISTENFSNITIDESRVEVNGTPKNLYVVKAVVYEIGILTEVDDNDTSFESQERVDLTFYDAHSNNSHINLGNIPLPIQTNVSGHVITGIAPVNVGAFSSPAELLQTLPLTGTIVNITHSDTAYYQLTKSNASSAERPQVIDENDVFKLPQVANLFKGESKKDPNDGESSVNSVERNDDD